MKKGLIVANALLALAVAAQAQNVNKQIKVKDVRQTIATLAADDMEGRATFSRGIDKAATYIERRFKAAGLQPLAGNSSFRQNIPSMIKTIPLQTRVSINGTLIPAENVMTASIGSFDWGSLDGIQIIKETADKDLRKDYRSIVNSGKKTLVLVDPAFADVFSTYRTRVMGGAALDKNHAPQQVVFVLGAVEEPKSLTVHYEADTKEMPLFNVAGMIPGKTKPDEYVVFSGHYDHLGIGKGMAPDSIYNGADDDASGTTAVIELAKYFKKQHNNQRTLIFVAFTAEEIGGFGARYFTSTTDPDKVVAMFNIEMIGKPSKFGRNSAFITGFDRSDFGKILQRNLQGTQFKFYPDPYPEQNLFYRSDNATLAMQGVPAHTISTDQIDIDHDYHQVTDELKTLDVENITLAIRAIALSSRTIVSGKDTPTRVAKFER